MNNFHRRELIGDFIRTIISHTTDSGGVSMTSLSETFGVDVATIKRWVSRLRDEYDMPIVGTQEGYVWRPSNEDEEYTWALQVVFCNKRSNRHGKNWRINSCCSNHLS